MNRASANNPRGALTFNANQGGYDFASFLLGYPASVISPEALHPTVPVANRWGAYFLDDWKVSSRLTLNMGLRWDYFGVPIDQDGAWRSLSFDNLYSAPNGAKIPTIIPAASRWRLIKL
jgi:outer membrane receptor protein involved in Fe transport